jgi:hypothetical protein
VTCTTRTVLTRSAVALYASSRFSFNVFQSVITASFLASALQLLAQAPLVLQGCLALLKQPCGSRYLTLRVGHERNF